TLSPAPPRTKMSCASSSPPSASENRPGPPGETQENTGHFAAIGCHWSCMGMPAAGRYGVNRPRDLKPLYGSEEEEFEASSRYHDCDCCRDPCVSGAHSCLAAPRMEAGHQR